MSPTTKSALRMKSILCSKSPSMDADTLPSFKRKQASVRNCLVSGFSTELIEVDSEKPFLNVLFIPGNPGIVSFYKDFAEALYEQLEGSASITGFGIWKTVLIARANKSQGGFHQWRTSK